MGLYRLGRRAEVRLLTDDLPREALEFLARPEAEIVFEGAPRPLVDLECLYVPTRPIQRHHELRDEALAIRRLLDQPPQLSHELPVAAKGKFRVDADLECPRAKLVQAVGVRAAVQVQRDPGEYRAVPEAECLFRDGCGTRMVTGGQSLRRLVYEVVEELRVENGPTEVDPVAAAPSFEGNPVGGESPAESGHVRLQAVRCGSREVISPDLIEQALDGHHLVPAEKQSCENSALLAPAELERVSPDLGFEPAENAEPERF